MTKPNKLFTLGMIIKDINQYYPNLKFWDGVNEHETYNPKSSYKHRQGMSNEIRIEFDDENRDKNFENIMLTAFNLYQEKYSFAIFYVEGGRSPHIHIYDIDELDNLTIEKRTEYRKLFLNKFCSKGSNPDLGLCDEKHLCALEFVNHFKYRKPKALLHYFWQGKNQGCDWDLKMKSIDDEERQREILQKKLEFLSKVYETNSPFKQQVEKVLTFEKVFDWYGVKYRGTMACCPFHNDTAYSLSFNNEKKLFHCFGTGCGVKGKILTLIKYLERRKRK
jgi:hypothetical protein